MLIKIIAMTLFGTQEKMSHGYTTGKGERLVIVNAISSSGWVNGAKLVFQATRKTGDYHGQMNTSLFQKWFSEKLIPNIPEHSLIIMDNASYHNILSVCSPPTSTCKKDRIWKWLIENNRVKKIA